MLNYAMCLLEEIQRNQRTAHVEESLWGCVTKREERERWIGEK